MISGPVLAQHIEKIDASKAPSYRPDDLLLADHGICGISAGSGRAEQCEPVYFGRPRPQRRAQQGLGPNLGRLSQLCAGRIQRVETSKTPGRYSRSKVEKQISQVVKGAAKSCRRLRRL